ncbi:hypothetical protein BOX37_26595 [Nocardia mangyaensis]|uniref:Uncharacterized protein n=1 Tax=Nocardia mangyaensis TaxID=2213200 RepID=A0A1J0VY94_9NOCA|nr:hypothetical protein BOX37_26595 [Nocardia mangyaensis]
MAEFRLTSQGTIELTCTDEEGCPLAQRWFAERIDLVTASRSVTPDDGPAFMRALLQPFLMSHERGTWAAKTNGPEPCRAQDRRANHRATVAAAGRTGSATRPR